MQLSLRLALPIILAFSMSGASTAADVNDEAAIMNLLRTYSNAVSSKNEALFETLLLSKDIPFAYVPRKPTNNNAADWRSYDDFKQGVFGGGTFTQRFKDVKIRQHGALADVDLVYVNDDGHTAHAGWKTMQLIRISGSWKIASEFYTGLPDSESGVSPSK